MSGREISRSSLLIYFRWRRQRQTLTLKQRSRFRLRTIIMLMAVLIFHAREAKEEDGRLIQVISRIATQLGFALQHKRLEEELLKQQTLVLSKPCKLGRTGRARTAELSSANQMLQAEVSTREQIEYRMQERARQQEAIADIGRQALGGADLSALMQAITALVAKTLSVEFCKVLELLPGNDALLLRAGVGWREGLVGQATVSAGTNSQAGYTLLSGSR